MSFSHITKVGCFGIFKTFVSLVLIACSGGTPKQSRPVKTTKTLASPISTTKSVLRLGEPKDSSCRGYKAPPEDANTGCKFVGPYPGEITGDPLGSPDTFEEAVAACQKAPNCTGISTPWYLDKPFTAYAQTRPFKSDEDSYGCTFILVCKHAECED